MPDTTNLPQPPPGLERAIFQILASHAGRGNPISRLELCRRLSRFKTSERSVRVCIHRMRRSGCLIGSTGGNHGGYYLITTQEELRHFLKTEYQARALNMLGTVSAMNKAADRRWGPGSQQLELLEDAP